MMDEISSREGYLRYFSDDSKENHKQREALKQALDIRKFEIELYWKRTTYFWTIIAAIFAGFFLSQKSDGTPRFVPVFILSNLGFLFSVGWYFVNRGSKAWQRNWEAHVDLLEDEIMGPLYKTGLNHHGYHFWSLTEAYPFSVSKINQILSLSVAAFWMFLIVHSTQYMNTEYQSDWWTFGVSLAITFGAIICFIKRGKTSKTYAKLQVKLSQREYIDG